MKAVELANSLGMKFKFSDDAVRGAIQKYQGFNKSIEDL
jgi:hypothetical protein